MGEIGWEDLYFAVWVSGNHFEVLCTVKPAYSGHAI